MEQAVLYARKDKTYSRVGVYDWGKAASIGSELLNTGKATGYQIIHDGLTAQEELSRKQLDEYTRKGFGK